MIADEFSTNIFPNIQTSIEQGTTIALIISIIKKTPIYFKNAISKTQFIKRLNENGLSRIFVEEIDKQLRATQLPFGVKNHYTDDFYGTTGIPDFYFHGLEIGKTAPAFFIVESKRLPAPTKAREKEYVIGESLK